MPPIASFGISVLFSIIVWGVVATQYIWPALRRRQVADALRPLLILNSFRFLGLAFIVPGVVSPDLPADFGRLLAYGDLVAAILALIALAALRGPLGTTLVWAFNLWGTADLLEGFYHGISHGMVPGQFGATYFILTFYVPLLLLSHGLVFRLLIKRDVSAIASNTSRATT